MLFIAGSLLGALHGCCPGLIVNSPRSGWRRCLSSGSPKSASRPTCSHTVDDRYGNWRGTWALRPPLLVKSLARFHDSCHRDRGARSIGVGWPARHVRPIAFGFAKLPSMISSSWRDRISMNCLCSSARLSTRARSGRGESPHGRGPARTAHGGWFTVDLGPYVAREPAKRWPSAPDGLGGHQTR